MISIQTVPLGPGPHLFLLAILACVILAILAALKLYARRLRNRLLPQRPGHTEDSFVHHLASIGLNPRIARTTYRHLQHQRSIGYPILIGDALKEDLGLDHRSVTETIRTLLAENDRELPAGYIRSYIVTVGDLVGFIQSSPRAEFEEAA